MNLDYQTSASQIHLELKGDYRGFDNPEAVRKLLYAASLPQFKEVAIDGAALKEWDSALLAFLYPLLKICRQRQIKARLENLPDNLQRLLELALKVDRRPEQPKSMRLSRLERLGAWVLEIWAGIKKGSVFIHTCLSSLRRLVGGAAVMRRVDFLFALEGCSYKAVGIVSLVSFMVGLILAFVGAIQLKTFGAQIYVASLVAIGMTRIMGAIMVGIIMAGRTGASYAATIGTMQVNEEIDALKTMGIPVSDFLVLPRIIALTLTMPLLTILADVTGIIGGATVGVVLLDIPLPEYWKYTFEALNLTNFWVGLFHGLVFGIIIALCGCYYGANAGRNADSVGKATTQAVVSAIVWMIVITGIITWIFEVLGI